MKTALLMIMLCFSSTAFAETVESKTEKEIQHLIAYLKTSNCEFNRNGTWYDSRTALGHIKRKYDYFNKRGLIRTAEDFIEHAPPKAP